MVRPSCDPSRAVSAKSIEEFYSSNHKTQGRRSFRASFFLPVQRLNIFSTQRSRAPVLVAAFFLRNTNKSQTKKAIRQDDLLLFIQATAPYALRRTIPSKPIAPGAISKKAEGSGVTNSVGRFDELTVATAPVASSSVTLAEPTNVELKYVPGGMPVNVKL
jgi:hypothetical protein